MLNPRTKLPIKWWWHRLPHVRDEVLLTVIQCDGDVQCGIADSFMFCTLPPPPPLPLFFYNYFKREENWDESAAEVIWRACSSASNALFICNVNDSGPHLNKPGPPLAAAAAAASAWACSAGRLSSASVWMTAQSLAFTHITSEWDLSDFQFRASHLTHRTACDTWNIWCGSNKASKFSRLKGPACECLGGSQSDLNRKHARWLLTRSETLMALSIFSYTGCPKKFVLILKAIILKTIQSSSLKFNN